MAKYNRTFLIVLIILNIVVLMGQIWPEGAPPFAHKVNVVFLILSLLYFIIAIRKKTWF